MARDYLLGVVVSAFSLTVGFQAADWPRFKSTEENFMISLPSEPQQERNNRKSPFGNGHHIYSVESNNISYTISYSSFDAPITDSKEIKRILGLSTDMVRIVTNGRVVSDKEIDLEGFLGREVRIEKDKRLWILRAFIVKERMYQLMTTQPKAKEESPETVKFYESFKLLSRPE